MPIHLHPVPALLAATIALAGLAPHAAAQESTTPATPAVATQDTSEPATSEGSATGETQSPSDTTGTGSTTTSGPSAAAINTARWLRAIGGRICLGPKLNHKTRVSLPNPADPTRGWRVSSPSFAHARLVKPPARARLANATLNDTPNDTPTSDGAQSDTIELATEPSTSE